MDCTLHSLHASAIDVLESCQSPKLLSADKISGLIISLDAACRKNEHNMVQTLDNHHLEIHHCLAIIENIVSRVSSKTSNYFGFFDAAIYAKEVDMMAEHLNMLTACASSMPYAYTHLDTHNISNTMSGNDHEIATREIKFSNYLFLKVFWLKHFQWAASVDWLEFRRLFEQEYGTQVDYAMDAFYQAVFGGSNYMMYISMRTRRVDFGQLQTLFAAAAVNGCSNYNATLFDIYQMYASPVSNCMVVLTGRVVPNTLEYPVPTIVRELLGLAIQSVSCGSLHVCVLTSTGQIYSWGKGESGRLGHGNDINQLQPKLLEFSKLVPMAQMSCGSSHSGAVSIAGQLYTWGRGHFGKLGQGDEQDCHTPCLVQGLDDAEQVKSFHAGQYHSCVLTAIGHVYTFGFSGCAGHRMSGVQGVLVPKQLDTFTRFPAVQISVAIDGFHTLVLTKLANLFTWGNNSKGQLGLPHEINTVQLPREVLGLPGKVKQVAAGTCHSCLLLDTGELYVCGSNVFGQLGLPASYDQDIQRSFVALKGAGEVFGKVSCGYHHTMLLSNSFGVYGMGCNTFHQIDASNMSHIITIPSKVQPFHDQGYRDVLQMSCGAVYSAYVLGSRKPASLRKLCSDMICCHAELRQLILEDASTEQLRQQGISHDYTEIVRSLLVYS